MVNLANKNNEIIIDVATKNNSGDSINQINLNDLTANFEKILGVEICEKWLKDIEIFSQSSHEIIIKTKSKFNRDWVNREFFSKKTFVNSLKEFYPKIIKISAIFIQSQDFNKAPQNRNNAVLGETKTETKILNLSKYDNVFAYGTELNPKFTFKNFIGAKHNKIALSMAKIVAGCPETPQLFDDKIPLFIHGNVGMGKTHLGQAIAWNIKDNDNSKKVVYLSAEKFMFHFVQSIRNNDIMEFKQKMRSIDVLIVDDVQFIAGKDSTQQEFMNCFNSLVEDNKQVVLICDRCPSTLENIDEKLKSRISGGMIINFKNPDLADRLQFLKVKAEQMDFKICHEILNFIAHNLKGSNRDLEGALKKLYAEQLFGETEIDLNFARSILSSYLNAKPSQNNITIEKVQKIIAEYFGIKIADLISKNRSKNIALARQIAMYFSKKYTPESLKIIGEKFSKNHATVIHAVKSISQLEKSCQKTSQDLHNIMAKLDIS